MRELMTSMIAMLSLFAVAGEKPAAGGPRYQAPDRPAVVETVGPAAADPARRSPGGAGRTDIAPAEPARARANEPAGNRQLAARRAFACYSR